MRIDNHICSRNLEMCFIRTLYCFGIGLLFAFCSCLQTVDACSPLLSEPVCENITCPNGKTCTGLRNYWCPKMIANIVGLCPTIPICDLANSNPCMTTSCSAATACVRVKDTCDSYGICSVKAQCNERNRPGFCPNPTDVQMQWNTCSIFCDDDAVCECGAKCCSLRSTAASKATSTEKICVKIS